jgi:hypothetical protein
VVERNKSAPLETRPEKASSREHSLGLSLIIVGLSAIFAIAQGLGAPQESEGHSKLAPLCGGWHRGAGETHEVDLEKLSRDYRALRDRLGNNLWKAVEAKPVIFPNGFDSGLPACRTSGVRLHRNSISIPAELRGKRLWFFDARTSGSVRLPREIEDDPRALLFLLGLKKLEDLGEIGKSLKRDVSISPREFAEALGVRCAPTFVVIGKDGELEIHENP